MVRRCIYCGKEINEGRSDRKFCDNGCRANFHNGKKYNSTIPKARVYRSLERNYSILCDVMAYRDGSARIWDLVDEGFRPEYVTSFIKGRGSDEMRCFDIRYRQSSQKIYNVRKKDDKEVVIETNLVSNE